MSAAALRVGFFFHEQPETCEDLPDLIEESTEAEALNSFEGPVVSLLFVDSTQGLSKERKKFLGGCLFNLVREALLETLYDMPAVGEL
ncbi:MAG: hypothetical protein HYY64_18615 [Candidatus Rokubacteria bacterium]|nr:hypothetical protein [Candidatus Rokubacteria bacterium]